MQTLVPAGPELHVHWPNAYVHLHIRTVPCVPDTAAATRVDGHASQHRHGCMLFSCLCVGVAQVLQPLLKDLDLGSFYFSNFKRLDIDGIPAWLTRTGCFPACACLDMELLLSQPCVSLEGARPAMARAWDRPAAAWPLTLHTQPVTEHRRRMASLRPHGGAMGG